MIISKKWSFSGKYRPCIGYFLAKVTNSEFFNGKISPQRYPVKDGKSSPGKNKRDQFWEKI